VVRIALPMVLRAVIASQASEALHAQVAVGDVDLRLWRGGVALEDVAIRAAGASAAAEAASSSATPHPDLPPQGGKELSPQAAPAFGDDAPLIAFKRFAVEIRYLPLFGKIIQLRDVELVSPRVALDRLADGNLNLVALVPKQEVAVEAGATPAAEATPTAAAAAEESGPGWGVGLDRFVLKDGRVRFRDLMLEGSEPVELGIDEINVQEIALTPEVYGKPARIDLKLGIDEGVVDVTAQLKLAGSHVTVATGVSATRLPLRRARLYVPNVGWSELNGELDLAVTYELEPDAKNELRGTLALRDVSVKVPSVEDAAATWRSFSADIERIDLRGQRALITSVALDGATLRVRVGGGRFLLPILEWASSAGETPAATATASPAIDTTPTPPPEATGDETAAPPQPPTDTPTPTPTAGVPIATPTPAAPSSAPDAADAAPPWEWHVGAIKIADSMVQVLSDQPQRDVGIALDVTNLGGKPDTIAHVALSVTPPDDSITIDGDLRLAEVPAFGGTVKIGRLALPPLLASYGTVPVETLSSGVLSADLTVRAGLPAGGGESPADRLLVSGTIGLADLRTAPPDAGVTFDVKQLDLGIDQLSVPGVIPPGQPAAAGAGLDIAIELALAEPHVVQSGDTPLDVQLQSLKLTVPSLTVPAALAGLGPGEGAQLVDADATLEIGGPRVALGGDATLVEAERIALALTDASIPVLKPAAPSPPTSGDGPPAAAAEAAAPPPAAAGEPPALPGAPPAKLTAQLDLVAAHVATAQGKDLDAQAKAIGLKLTDVVVPGFVAGAPAAATGEPLRAAATLAVSEVRAVRADGKEFAVAAKSIGVPLTALAVPGSLAALTAAAGTAPPAAPMQLTFGEIRIDAPDITVTRTKDGIVLPTGGGAPSSASAPAPAAPSPALTPAATPAATPVTAAPPVDLQVAALRVLQGELDFTDRAVQPVFTTRYDPIDIDLRNIRYPNLTVKPLKIDIANADGEGRISATGELAPGSGALDLEVTDFGLLGFNPYATTYSPYSIADGALSIKTTARYRGGRYEVKNDLTLHQFDLAGSEGDSLFEQQFGIPLSMALALLRDINGDIDLGIPLEVDEKGGATIDLIAVVRSALRQAITGAIASPLKMLGSVAGGKGAPLAPAPIAFRLGRAAPTTAGAESAERLAGFLATRPGMAVQLGTAATKDDARWLREQALRGEWEDEGFVDRTLAFVTQRGPRERIRTYLDARADDAAAELSAEDQATLEQWLDERPAPTPEQLHELAAARLAVVESVLRDKGIDAARVSHSEPPAEAAEGKPVVTLQLRASSKPQPVQN
jgi:hypothetical protein